MCGGSLGGGTMFYMLQESELNTASHVKTSGKYSIILLPWNVKGDWVVMEHPEYRSPRLVYFHLFLTE